MKCLSIPRLSVSDKVIPIPVRDRGMYRDMRDYEGSHKHLGEGHWETPISLHPSCLT